MGDGLTSRLNASYILSLLRYLFRANIIDS
nr:MAG TPA_asm: hypothetical protein [Caudoviricetes sp.]DAZ65716.1 MAG TPA: hypothetical protein [Caudoviricetes sp.]